MTITGGNKFLKTIMMPIISTGKKIKKIPNQSTNLLKSKITITYLYHFDKIYVPVYVSWFRT